MPSRRINPTVSLCVAALALVAAACSSGGDDDATLEAADQPTPTPLAAQPTPEPSGDDTATDTGDVATDAGGDDAPADGTNEGSAEDGAADGDTGAVDEPGDGTDGDGAADPDAEPTPTPDIDLSQPAFTERSKISTVGLDEVFFGMTADEAAAAADTAWEAEGSTTGECWIATPVNGPVGVSFMMWNGGVERVDVTTELITTRSGAGVGSTPDELQELFGDLLDTSDPNRLAFVPQDEEDADFRIFFEITDGAVSSYRAGRLPMAEYESCP